MKVIDEAILEKSMRNAYFNISQKYKQLDLKEFDELSETEKVVISSMWEQGWYFGTLGVAKPKGISQLS